MRWRAQFRSCCLQSAHAPVTVDEMCMTWLYRSMAISLSTLTLPASATFPTSFRPRSTSIICSDVSLSSASKSFSRAASSEGVAPRLRVPARGRLVITLLPSTRQRISGDAATRMQPRDCTEHLGDTGIKGTPACRAPVAAPTASGASSTVWELRGRARSEQAQEQTHLHVGHVGRRVHHSQPSYNEQK